MGWKISAIIIKTKTDHIVFKKLLNDLGFSRLIRIDDAPFGEANNILHQRFVEEYEYNRVYIGFYKNNLIIISSRPLMEFDKAISTTEQILINKFPDTEICTIELNSFIDLWGYSVIKNGQKIRARAGYYDAGTVLEYGDPLVQEKALLSKSIIDENGNRIYLFDDFPEEPLSEDQVGEEFVFEISSRYFGVRLDEAWDLFDTIFIGYEENPWWKFW